MTLGHFRMTLGSLWSHFGCIRVDFKKHLFSQSILMILQSNGVSLGSLWVTLGPLFAYEGDFGSISGRLWGHFGVTFDV